MSLKTRYSKVEYLILVGVTFKKICDFQLILESEMDKVKNHGNIVGSEFNKQPHHTSRPSSSMSNKSAGHDVMR